MARRRCGSGLWSCVGSKGNKFSWEVPPESEATTDNDQGATPSHNYCRGGRRRSNWSSPHRPPDWLSELEKQRRAVIGRDGRCAHT